MTNQQKKLLLDFLAEEISFLRKKYSDTNWAAAKIQKLIMIGEFLDGYEDETEPEPEAAIRTATENYYCGYSAGVKSERAKQIIQYVETDRDERDKKNLAIYDYNAAKYDTNHTIRRR